MSVTAKNVVLMRVVIKPFVVMVFDCDFLIINGTLNTPFCFFNVSVFYLHQKKKKKRHIPDSKNIMNAVPILKTICILEIIIRCLYTPQMLSALI